MKKFLSLLLFAMLSCSLFVSCSDSDDKESISLKFSETYSGRYTATLENDSYEIDAELYLGSSSFTLYFEGILPEWISDVKGTCKNDDSKFVLSRTHIMPDWDWIESKKDGWKTINVSDGEFTLTLSESDF